MLVVNLFGAPGAGKSTLAMLVAGILKTEYPHLTTECPDEIAKLAVYDGATKVFNCQLYIAGRQHWQVARCEGHVDIVVCDSPVLMSWVYGNDGQKIVPESFFDVCRFYHAAYPSLNFYVTRDHAYETRARIQDEAGAARLDAGIQRVLIDAEVTAFPVKSSMATASQIASMAARIVSDPKVISD